MPEDRRLAAIMFTDIVGYTALMGSDEDKAFDMLKRNHTIHATLIEKHNGTLIKEVGDGTLASFSLGSDAVRCAIDIQKEAKSQNIPLKIGIHEGEMVMAGEDVLGDGVNVASRLQEISADGSITISGRVYSDVKNKAGIKTKFIGDKRLKNVSDPVKVYKVLWEEEKEKPVEEQDVKSKFRLLYYVIAGIVVVLVAVIVWQLLPSKETSSSIPEVVDIEKSIAVLPFINDSPDQENEYFCNGVMDDILNHLAKIKDLKVLSRTDVEPFRGSLKTRKEIACELGVENLLEGSARKQGNRFKISLQLINAQSGFHLWSDEYEGEYTEEIFTVQSNIAREVASALKAVITPDEEQAIDVLPTTDMIAYDFFLKGLDMEMKYWGSFNDKDARLAHNLLDRALEIDPIYVEALCVKGSVFMAEGKYDSALLFADKAMIIDPENPVVYHLKAECNFSLGEYERAIEYYAKTISLMPKDRWGRAYYGLVRTYVYGKNDPISGLQIALNSPDEIGSVTGRNRAIFDCLMYLGDFERAEEYAWKTINSSTDCVGIEQLEQILFKQSKYVEALHFLDTICGARSCLEICYRNRFLVNLFQKEIEKAYDDYKTFIEVGGTLGFNDNVFLGYMYQELGQNQEALKILSSTLNTYENLGSDIVYYNISRRNIYKAAIYTLLDKKKEALICLSDAVETGLVLGWDVFLPQCPLFENLWGDPEFKALVKRAQDEKAHIRAQVQEMIDNGEIDL